MFGKSRGAVSGDEVTVNFPEEETKEIPFDPRRQTDTLLGNRGRSKGIRVENARDPGKKEKYKSY